MLSFAEIIQGRDASVYVTHDNMMIAVDLAVVLSGKNRFCVSAINKYCETPKQELFDVLGFFWCFGR
jgi:hypothetical protein